MLGIFNRKNGRKGKGSWAEGLEIKQLFEEE
jgi:hypothetical protein